MASRGFNEEGDGGNVFGLLHDREGEGKVEEVANGKKEVTSAHGQSQHNNGHKQASDIHHGQ